MQPDDQRFALGSMSSLSQASSAVVKSTPERVTAELVVLDAAQLDIQDRAWFAFLDAAPHLSRARVIYEALAKRLLDIVFASLLLVLLAPVLLLIGLIIRVGTRGPALYKQPRVGRYGETFTVYKLRTMISDRRKTDLPFVGNERRQRHKTEADPRVTRVGRLLRRTSIDEWPQLINILRGEMSFIGPRPELPAIVRKYEPWQHQRHLVRPGMSGWWQIHGRSDRPMHDNTELDIYYVANLSFRLDFAIFLRTFKAVLSRSGAF